MISYCGTERVKEVDSLFQPVLGWSLIVDWELDMLLLTAAETVNINFNI